MSANRQSETIDLGDLAPIEVRYRIGGKDYVLREASEAAASTWERHRINSRQYNEEGRFVELKDGYEDSDSLLLSLCLFEPSVNDGITARILPKPVPIEVIKSWPSRIVEPLVKKCKEISDLDISESADTIRKEIEILQRRLAKLEGEGSPKNGQYAGTDTSVSATS